jgi:hypothetical protein
MRREKIQINKIRTQKEKIITNTEEIQSLGKNLKIHIQIDWKI